MKVPQEIHALWEQYDLPEYKRNHSYWVSILAVWFARQWMHTHPREHIDMALLEKAALLHDLDKNMKKQPGEKHPDATVRVLRSLGFIDVARVIATHPLHMILASRGAPESIEERLLYLADKMVKHDIITVDERFSLWRAEQLPSDAIDMLRAAYPKVKALEKKLCDAIGVAPSDIRLLVKDENSGTIESGV